MPFVNGAPSANPLGRPKGGSTGVSLNKSEKRLVIKQLVIRAKSGDPTSVDVLALLMLQGSAAQGIGT